MQDPKSVGRLRRGDAGTLKRIFKSSFPKLYPLAYRLCRTSEGANQVIRQSFKQLWHDRMDLDPLEVIDLRLLAYAYSRSMEYRADHYITGIEFSTKASQGEEVMRQLDSIQEDERLIYLLHVVDGYSVREIARAYGKSEDTTREMIGAALVSLDNVFGHDDPESVASGSSNGTFSQLL